jgi:restriction system protein
MGIPDYQTIMLPLLRLCEDKQEHSLWQSVDDLESKFSLTHEERQELLPSGQQAIFNNRVGWARTYLKKAGLLESTKRGYFQITVRGLEVLKQNPPSIDVELLMQFEEFREFKKLKKSELPERKEKTEDHRTPEEILESAYQNLRDELTSDLLKQVKASPPSFFEKIVIELLVAMGYGGSLEDAGKAIGKPGDEGIDGVIKEDRLGLDVVYIQAKKWENTVVGRPEIQKFAGALQGQRANKGIFITTSSFSKEAQDYALRIANKIVLIDGNQLVQYMVDFNIAVNPMTKYEIKRIDMDYFAGE